MQRACTRRAAAAALICALSTHAHPLHAPTDFSSTVRWACSIPCGYADDPPTAVGNELRRTVVAQDAAIQNITDAVAAWHTDHVNGVSRPLVLVFAGGTGVGKTESARAVARGLLTGRRSLVGAPGKTTPEGELHLFGGDFRASAAGGGADAPPADAGADMTALQERLRDSVAQLLYECHGQGVVILDETQKMPKHALAPLRRVFQGEDAVVQHETVGQLSAARMVLIVISDVGMGEVSSFVNSVYAQPLGRGGADGSGAGTTEPPAPPLPAPAKRMDVMHAFLAARMRTAIDREFSAGAFDLGALADSVIAYVPFSQEGVRALLHRWLADARDSVTVKKYAHALTWSAAFVDTLSTPRYARYGMTEPDAPTVSSACYNESRVQVARRKQAFAARGGALKGAARPAASAGAAVTADGTTHAPAGGTGEEEGGGAEPSTRPASVCGEECDVPRVCYLTGGARGLRIHVEGSWRKLQVTLERELKKQPRVTEALQRAFGRGVHILGAERVGGAAAGAGKRAGTGADSLWDRVHRAAGSLVSRVTGAEDPAIAAAAARGEERRRQSPAFSGLPLHGSPVDGQRGAAARLHLDVSCAGHVPDGACGLRGVTFTLSRCLGQPTPVGQVEEDDEDAASPSEAPAKRAYVWQEECSVFFEGDIM